ncbi:hypothetical protein AOCH_007578 [Aspergillus ochraceoroseus]|uniref:Uncharacterized protein n=1 Tax=Aspergillus ochraceoroseus TaxID=138278 RepID=A0A0F8UQJ6_9EURO|nr:hypothetical protein AOCH_007578 [Aspergillus ochraceoroseus]
MKYIIGGTQYEARSEGQVAIGPREQSLPIVSFTGWFIGQTWSEFFWGNTQYNVGTACENPGCLEGKQGIDAFTRSFRE